MILQIHESIGHPLELDRILGDERNYAGTSFVTLDMFGSYRYGSDLLNVVWDPTRTEQLASYGFDDEGMPASREFIIREGILLRPLGGATSQARAGMQGVSTTRASGWNRPPIDRMANLNSSPATSRSTSSCRASSAGSTWRPTTPVHRRLPQQVPVRLRARASHRGRRAQGRRARPQLPGHLGDVLAEPQGRGGHEHVPGARDPELRQGRAQSARAGRARAACLFENVEVFGGA